MTITEQALYENWLHKLEALKAENAKHDFSLEGQAAYYVAFMSAKQAYHLLCDWTPNPTTTFQAGMMEVYP